LGQPEIKLGLIPGGGGTQRLPRLVGHGRAMLLNMSGEFIDASTAERWGLVERVVPASDLLDAAKGVAASFAAQSPVPIGVLRELAGDPRGRYPQPPDLPWTPGAEVGGIADGKPVVGLVRQSGGGFAEQAAVDRYWLFPVPEGGTFAQAASFLMPFLTAWLPLTRQASITHGKRVLVTAA